MDYEKLLKDIDERFLDAQRNVIAMESSLSTGRVEMNRLQGEYRIIARMKAEAMAKSESAPLPFGEIGE
jgi:hypothetical protein